MKSNSASFFGLGARPRKKFARSLRAQQRGIRYGPNSEMPTVRFLTRLSRKRAFLSVLERHDIQEIPDNYSFFSFMSQFMNLEGKSKKYRPETGKISPWESLSIDFLHISSRTTCILKQEQLFTQEVQFCECSVLENIGESIPKPFARYTGWS